MKLNEFVNKKDQVLTEGQLVPYEKAGKDATKPENYRPVTLLPVWRKLLSKILLQRIIRSLSNRYQTRNLHIDKIGPLATEYLDTKTC